MRSTRLLSVVGAAWLASLAACQRGGPQLPDNVGESHSRERTAGSSRPDPGPPAAPLEVGTTVWGNFRDTGFYFHGMVVERRDDRHHVLYDDGAAEWLEPDALLPDTLGEGAAIHVRAGYDAEFAEGTSVRVVGDAVYARLAGGNEVWTTLPHVRFAADGDGVPRRGDAPAEQRPVEGFAPGAPVLINYQSQNLRFAAIVTARREEDGRLHVVYLDGETEWIDPRLVGPDDLAEGDVVHIRRTWEPPVWVRGRVQARMGDAFRVELDDGGLAWTSLLRLRAPVRAPSAAPAETAHEDADGAPDPDEPPGVF